MKLAYQLLLALSSTILLSCFLTLNNLKPQVNSEVAIAQRPPGRLDTSEIMKRLRNGSKVTYRTAKLRHKNTNTTAYLEVTLKPQFSGTEAIALIIETNGQTKKLPRNFGFRTDISILLNIVAFSPDGRYLIIRGGQLPGDMVATIFVDLKNNYQTLNLEPRECYGILYEGFITAEEALFGCNNFNVRQAIPKIVLNLSNGNVRDVSRQSFDLLPETYDRLTQPSIL